MVRPALNYPFTREPSARMSLIFASFTLKWAGSPTTGIYVDGFVQIGDYLYRWRQGRASISRLSDCGARNAMRFSGNQLFAAQRRITQSGAKAKVQKSCHASYDGA